LSLPAKIIEQRPDVRAAEAQLHAANAQVGVAVAAMLPQFSITGSYGGNATQIPWMFRQAARSGHCTAASASPYSKAGRCCTASVPPTQALKQAAAQYQSTVMTAYQNVADTLHASLSDADALAADVERKTRPK
jgi:outer membrane protein TolC